MKKTITRIGLTLTICLMLTGVSFAAINDSDAQVPTARVTVLVQNLSDVPNTLDIMVYDFNTDEYYLYVFNTPEADFGPYDAKRFELDLPAGKYDLYVNRLDGHGNGNILETFTVNAHTSGILKVAFSYSTGIFFENLLR